MFEADREYPPELFNAVRTALETRLELNKFNLKYKKSAKVGANLSAAESLERKERDAWVKVALPAKEYGVTRGTVAMYLGVIQEIDPNQYENLRKLTGVKEMGRVKNGGAAYEIKWE